MANLGVPVKLLHESLGHIVTVELKSGEMYRGKLMEGEYARRAQRGERTGWLQPEVMVGLSGCCVVLLWCCAVVLLCADTLFYLAPLPSLALRSSLR